MLTKNQAALRLQPRKFARPRPLVPDLPFDSTPRFVQRQVAGGPTTFSKRYLGFEFRVPFFLTDENASKSHLINGVSANLSSSVNLKSGIARHGRALISIILVQMLLIFWLASWAVGDYLNNQYVRAYVNLTVQSDAWAIGLLAFVGVLGSSMGLVLKRRKHASATLEVSNKQSRIPKPAIPTMPGKLNVQPSPSTKPSAELHPAVAALKADLSEARLSLGLASVTTGNAGPTNSPTTQPARFDDQKQTIGTQSPPISRPFLPPNPQAVTSNQQTFPAGPRPVPSTVIRPMAPTMPSGPIPARQPMPMLNVQSIPSAPPKPVGLLPRPEQVPANAAKDVSTVITGIMPVQQDKKKEQGSSNSQSASSN